MLFRSAEAARRAKIDPAKAHAYYIEKEPSAFAQFVEDWLEDDSQQAAMPRDWLTHQAWLQRYWAAQAVSDVRGMLSGSSIRASCLECAGYEAPRQAKAADKGFWAGLVALAGRI